MDLQIQIPGYKYHSLSNTGSYVLEANHVEMIGHNYFKIFY